MDAESANSSIPMPRIALALLLGALPPLLLVACFGLAVEHEWAMFFNGIGVFAVYALSSVLCVGIPVGAILLRNPQMPLLRWVIAGMASGAIAFMLMGLWFFGLYLPLMFLSFFGPVLLASLIVTLVFGGLTGLCARTILGWLSWR